MLMATFNGASTLPRVLSAYCRLMVPACGWRLIVIDNGSTDDTPGILAQFARSLPMQVLHEPRRGKNIALNRGLDAAGRCGPHELLVFTDDDATPQPDWLVRLYDASWRQPLFDMFGGAIEPDWAAEPPAWIAACVPLGLTYGITEAGRPAGPVFAGLVWGANMAIRGHLFAAGLRFDDSVGPAAGSYPMGGETELTRRLAASGHRAWFCPEARVAHHIRQRQLNEDWILERARRYGRGQYRQAPHGAFPELLGVPRWMFAKASAEAARWLGAVLRGDRKQRFLHRWELAYLRGYIGEAWRGGTAGKRVFITSYSGELGGMELRMAQEADYLRAAGCESVLAVPRFRGSRNWLRSLRGRGLDARHFTPPPVFEQWRWRRVNRWRAAVWWTGRMRRARPDLVHVAYCWSSYGNTALWLASRCELPAVISVHNAFPPDSFSSWHRPLLKEAFRCVRGVYAVSSSALQHFLALYRDFLPESALRAVIPNGVDTRRFQPSQAARQSMRQRLGIEPDALVIGSVGRLSPQKRPEMLVRLLAELLPRFPGLRLVLAGSGPLERALRRSVDARQLSGHVIFAGYQERVEELLPALDLHLLLSSREGFGIATIEAMACGVPAVATDVPGNADVLGLSAGGVLVPPDDLHAMAATVAGLLAAPLRRAVMGERGRAEVCARYDHSKIQAQVQAFYRGLL
ncbi:glycosyltransferase [Massilia endophytica]|uniref:glycosyltransferase n=1 Tax=Massilia endophytica TaxID=2899220 RepID=UPI001E5DBB26|nr:glycosyltransferase [Massilia endophytica]UGQ49225.1 glycosyltransferase [Massilia endophytica]